LSVALAVGVFLFHEWLIRKAYISPWSLAYLGVEMILILIICPLMLAYFGDTKEMIDKTKSQMQDQMTELLAKTV
jgi:hypothetical protein